MKDERTKKESTGQYGELVARLQQLVDALEHGDLSLEESLERFAEGVQLVKRGEKLLAEAEKKIELLLSDDGQTQPLEVASTPAEPVRPAFPRPVKDDRDVPF